MKAAQLAFVELVDVPSLGTREGKSDVFGVVEGHHLTLRILEYFVHSCVLLLPPQKKP